MGSKDKNGQSLNAPGFDTAAASPADLAQAHKSLERQFLDYIARVIAADVLAELGHDPEEAFRV